MIKQYSKLRRMKEPYGLELLTATCNNLYFPRHMHETFFIAVIEKGVNKFYCRGALHTAPAGSIIVINPNEVHAGYAGRQGLLSYRSMYAAVDLLVEAACRIDERTCDVPYFPSPVIIDDRLTGLILRLHRILEKDVNYLESRSLILTILSQLILRHAQKESELRPVVNENLAIMRAKEYISNNFFRNVTLKQLARISGLSSFYFIRTFRKQVGLSPHEFLVNVRVKRAKELLAKGNSIAQVAYRTGFSDQSHLTRRFKSIIGVTPGQYLKKSKFVQDTKHLKS